MVVENAVLTFPKELTRMIQALGGILILYLIFGIINSVIAFNRNRKIDKVIKSVLGLRGEIEDIKKILVKKL